LAFRPTLNPIARSHAAATNSGERERSLPGRGGSRRRWIVLKNDAGELAAPGVQDECLTTAASREAISHVGATTRRRFKRRIYMLFTETRC
jgi:hypothetical protein